MNMFLYDSRSPRCKWPFGAVKTGEPVTFSIFLPISYQLGNPRLLLYLADCWEEPETTLPMEFIQSDGIQYQYSCSFCPETPSLYFYLFEVDGANGKLHIERDEDGFGRLSWPGAGKWQLTVYDSGFSTPDFLKAGVMYQIFPDRFYNSGQKKEEVPMDRWVHKDWNELPEYLPDKNGEVTNSDYFGGDLKGIEEKLPYLKSLGVSCIYLNPIFEAHSNHRYNTADFTKVDPLLGSEEDLRSLCRSAKKCGVRILLDGVFNHTGSDSVYFNKNRRYGDGGAYNDPQSPYRCWYEFNDYPHSYNSWWGFLTLPNIRETEPSYRDFICGEEGVLQKWMDCGIAGFRLDVADELPDEFLDAITARLKKADPQAAVVGEVWEDASNKFSYGVRRRYLLGKQLDSVMNYPFRDAILQYVRGGNSIFLYRTIMDILEHYPKPVLDVMMNSLSTHDVERAITMLGGEPVDGNGRDWQGQNHDLSPEKYELGRKRFRLASVIQYMLPGIPCLYYGDEAGLYGYKDPFNRTTYPWGREDPILLETFRRLGQIRASHPGLAEGSFTAVQFTPEVCSFIRGCGDDEFFVAVNRTDKPRRIEMPGWFLEAACLFGAREGQTLPPYEGVILHYSAPGEG